MITNTQFLKLIEKPQNRKDIIEASNLEKELQAYATGEYQDVLLKKYLPLLVEERHPKFKQTFKVHTMPILNKVITHFQRVFDAQGRHIEARFTNPEQKIDFDAYVKNLYLSDYSKLNGISNDLFYSKELLNYLLLAPNKVLYINFLQDSIDNRNAPILRTHNISNVIDVDAGAKGLKYIVLHSEKKQEGKKYEQFLCIDGVRLVLFEKKTSDQKPVFISEVYHNLNCVPATFASEINLYDDNYIIRKSPISDSLPDLEQWLFLKNLMKVHQYETGAPLKFSPETKCNALHSETGTPCNNGQFEIVRDDNTIDIQPCYVCLHRKAKEKIAFGKEVEIPIEFFAQESMNRPADLLKSYGYVATDIEGLKFNEQDLKAKREQIEIDIIGKGFSATKEARNEKDVKADIEDLERVLSTVSKNIENTWQWVETKIIEARDYDSFVDFNCFLGRGYLLKSKLEHQQEYENLKAVGADAYLLNKKLSDITQTQYHYDNNAIQIFEIFASLIPFRHTSLNELYANSDIYMQSENTKKDFYLAIYAAQWIQEFLTNNDISIWGIEISHGAKVRRLQKYFDNKLKQILKDGEASTNE